MDIISKKEAKEQGSIFYFTGKPCKYGHLSYRMVTGGVCRECRDIKSSKHRNENREAHNKYCRDKKRESYNPEKRRESYIKNNRIGMLQAAKTRAKNKNLSFTITIDDVIIPTMCPILNIPLDYRDRLHAPSLDRIVNNLGYVKGNVQVISSKANRLKNNGTIEEFEQILKYMKSNANTK